MFKVTYRYSLIAYICYAGHLGSVGVSKVSSLVKLLKISVKHSFPMWCFLWCSINADQKPFIEDTDTGTDRQTRERPGRHRFRLLQWTGYHQEMAKDTGREMQEFKIWALSWWNCSRSQSDFFFLMWCQHILGTLRLSRMCLHWCKWLI